MLALNYKRYKWIFSYSLHTSVVKGAKHLILACFLLSAFKEAKRDEVQLRFCGGLLPTSDNGFSEYSRYSDQLFIIYPCC